MDFLDKEKVPRNKSGIYLLTNIVNNKVYIGKAKNIYNRIGQHRRDSGYIDKRKSYIHRAITCYGIDNFSVSILELYDSIEEYILYGGEEEKYWIQYYHSYDRKKGYNLTLGGDGVVGWHHTKEWKEKHSKEMIGKNNPSYNKHTNGKRVKCIETGIEYNSTREAEKITGILHCGISSACRGEYKQYKGFHWIYV